MSYIVRKDFQEIPARRHLTPQEFRELKALDEKNDALNEEELSRYENLKNKVITRHGAAVVEMDKLLVEVFCDIHKMLMVPVTYEWGVGTDKWLLSMFRCNGGNCSRHFAELHGYFDMKDRQMDKTNHSIKHCSKHPGAVAIVAIEDGTLTWDCIHPDCEDYEAY